MYKKMYFVNLRKNAGAGLFVPKILWKKKCNSCNIKLERNFYHEIMHCSCSVQSLIPDGTDTERDHRSGRGISCNIRNRLHLHRPESAAALIIENR